MISFFPTPYPDELWYSVICRYHIHSGNSCAKHTLRQLYGDNFSAPSLMLCGAINTLLAQLPQGFLSAKDVVMQHTFFPYYARFFPTQRKRSTYAYAVNGNPLTVHRMGISQANGNHCSIMRYCPICYQEDLQLYGEPYWHRSHQLPDMQICTKHRCWLVDTDVTYNSARQQELFPATFTMQLKKQPAEPVSDCLQALDLLLQDLDLEDGDADLQERIKKLNMGEDAPEGLLYSTEVPTIADGLVDMLHQTLCSNPSIKLVVIDTLGVVLGAQSNDSNSFTQEYALFHSLKKVAADHAIALLVIHHLRKANDENNPFNRIYGSVATQAALDTMMVLEKDTHFSDTAQLHISGRRCAQQEFVLSFDTDSCSWSMVGNADEVDEKFHHAQYERSETVIAIKEAISRGNGTWRGSMSQLSRVAESINALQLFHGSIDTACGRYFFFSPVGGNTKHPTGVKSKLLRTRGKRKMKQTVKTSRVAGQLEKMFRLLNNHFFNGELPEVVISLKKTVGAYGHFTCGKVWQAGDERRYEINISSATLNRPIEETCATLLHEMCHLACAVGYSSKVLDENGKPEPIKDTSNNGVYHNKKFKAMAEAHGLEVEHHPKYGWTITSPGIDLLDFIEQQGWQDLQMVEGISLLDVLGTLPKGSSGAGAETRTKKPSSTRKYICPKCGNSCRATKVINLICGDCMEKMVVAE